MSTNYDDRFGMTEERKAEVARELGMDAIPVPRYDEMPTVSDAAWATEKFNHLKAIELVDPIASASFMGYLEPLGIPIDQQINARDFKRGWSQAVQLDCGKPIPVNEKVTAATGITATPCERNWYGWLALNVKWVFDESGARAISPVLIARTHGMKRHRRIIGRYLFAIYKLDRTPAYGKTELDMVANVGMLHPSTIHSENKRLPVAGRTEIPGIDAPAAADPTPTIG